MTAARQDGPGGGWGLWRGFAGSVTAQGVGGSMGGSLASAMPVRRAVWLTPTRRDAAILNGKAVRYARDLQKKSSPASNATAAAATVQRRPLDGAEDSAAATTRVGLTGVAAAIDSEGIAASCAASGRSVANGSRGGLGPGCTAL